MRIPLGINIGKTRDLEARGSPLPSSIKITVLQSGLAVACRNVLPGEANLTSHSSVVRRRPGLQPGTRCRLSCNLFPPPGPDSPFVQPDVSKPVHHRNAISPLFPAFPFGDPRRGNANPVRCHSPHNASQQQQQNAGFHPSFSFANVASIRTCRMICSVFCPSSSPSQWHCRHQ